MIKKLAIISFTERGEALAKRAGGALADALECMLYTKRGSACAGEETEKVEEPLDIWVGRQFKAGCGILFVGACGIAVRGIAGHVCDKLSDAPVLVMDEAGRFVIPLLSGHYGGANELAKLLAERLCAMPVITTATDVNGLFAVDVFARKNGLCIGNREGIARVSAKLLRGERITMAVSGAYEGEPPAEVALLPYPPEGDVDVLVAPEEPAGFRAELWLVPRCIVLGMGCKKGKGETELGTFARRALEGRGLPVQAVTTLASIDRKAAEEGFLAFAKAQGITFCTYPAATLAAVAGEFPASAFVEAQVGVDNVCERAAMCAAGEGAKLLLPKTAQDGMTVAVAEKRWSVNFDEA